MNTYFVETYGCQMNVAESAALELALQERGWAAASKAAGADLVLINTCAVRATAEQRALGRFAQYRALKEKQGGRAFTLVAAGCMAERLRDVLQKDYAVDYVLSPGAGIGPVLDALAWGGEAAVIPKTKKTTDLTDHTDGHCNLPEGRGERARKKRATQGPLRGGQATATYQKGKPLQGPSVSSVRSVVEFGIAGEAGEAGEVREEETPVFAPLHLAPGSLNEKSGKSFLPIMKGCNNFCSYCIVPYLRGREVSRDPASIKAELKNLAEKGVREVTLLGQNVNSYRWEGEGGPLDFPALLQNVAQAVEGTGLRWVRFLSSHPKDLSDRAIQVMAEHPVFCRHLHLCVQHGSNRILAAMNRRYTREDYLALVGRLRSAMPGITLSTDILVGFPGETEEDVEETLALMKEVKFLYAFIYHYNPREGTAAFALPGRIAEAVKRERLLRVTALQKRHTRERLESRLGRRERVLVEGLSRKSADDLLCRTEGDEMVAAPGPVEAVGAFAELTLSSLRGNTFRGKELRVCL